MILLSFVFLVAYLIFWRHNKEIRCVTSNVLDRVAFIKYFECPLDELVSKGIVKYSYEKTKYYYIALACLSVSIISICVKLIKTLLEIV